MSRKTAQVSRDSVNNGFSEIKFDKRLLQTRQNHNSGHQPVVHEQIRTN